MESSPSSLLDLKGTRVVLGRLEDTPSLLNHPDFHFVKEWAQRMGPILGNVSAATSPTVPPQPESVELEQPSVGDRVYASAKHHNGMWYWGVVKDKFWKGKHLYYSVRKICDFWDYVLSSQILTKHSLYCFSIRFYLMTTVSLSKSLEPRTALPHRPWLTMAV